MSDPYLGDNPIYYPGIGIQAAGRPKDVSVAINNLLGGSLNVTRELSLSTSPTTVKDPRIHPYSFIGLMPIGSGAPSFGVVAIREGEVDIAWTGTGSWLVRMLIIG